MSPPEADVLRSRLVATWATVCAAQVSQGPWPETANVIEAVTRKDLIPFTEAMIQAYVERILIIHTIRA